MRIALAVLLCAAAPALASGPFWTASPQDRVALAPADDLIIGAASIVVVVVPELLMKSLAPAHCVFCNGPDNSGLPGDPRNGRGTLNPVDAFFHDQLTGFLLERKTADTVSSILAFASLASALGGAFATTGPAATEGAGLRAAVIVAESTAASMALVQGVKFFVARKRPFVRYGDGSSGSSPGLGATYDVTNVDSHLSFPSGHTALATSALVSLAMTATLEESRAAPVLWTVAAAGSFAIGSLRVIAEQHYFTDVAVGALVGASCGVLFPLLHARGGALAKSISIAPASSGAPSLVFGGRF